MLTWLLAVFRSPQAVEGGASVPRWLLAGGCPRGPLQHGHLLYQSLQAEGAIEKGC